MNQDVMNSALHSPASQVSQRPIGGILTVGFSIAVVMWAIGYFSHLPGAVLPSGVVFAMLAAALVGGGIAAARRTTLSLGTLAAAGALTGFINLLIVGSLFGGKHRDSLLPAELGRVAAIWSITTVLLCSLGVLIGAGIGRSLSSHPLDAKPENWRFRFALTACFATLLLLSLGGAVTGFDAGLAVPDWPNTYGTNMFLFPLSKMTGGIYFEHAHRLVGALVGMTTLTLMGYLLFVERRWSVKAFAVALGILVVVQGILGALRVTGTITLSQNPKDLAPNLSLAVVHGVVAQLFFSGLIALTAFLSATWSASNRPQPHPRAATDRFLGLACAGLILLQTIFGALLRHYSGNAAAQAANPSLGWTLHAHLTLAAIVALLLGAYAIRIWSLYEVEPLSRLGATLIGLLLAQILLGFGALAATMTDANGNSTNPIQVLVTTLHQTTGAVVLGATMLTIVWHGRLVRAAAMAELETTRTVAAD